MKGHTLKKFPAFNGIVANSQTLGHVYSHFESNLHAHNLS
jgi:hypothetical protein